MCKYRFVLCLLLWFLWQPNARAAIWTHFYPVHESKEKRGRIVICPTDLKSALGKGSPPTLCPQRKDLLRQDTKSGKIVRLQTVCVPHPDDENTSSRKPCFLDECVSAGTYRYGFKNPFPCSNESAGSDHYRSFYYGEIEVKGAASTCKRTQTKAPTSASAVPWKDEKLICENLPLLGCWVGDRPNAQMGPLFLLLLGLGLGMVRRKRRIR